ncbi:hypothetical protein BS47DRAFT_1365083 [Hydnum rufescens UP504]|uniref:Uncharacterized protein n=1 Tax=Hydnum rufescens UP504 TaxID=1448309 RepID=A0A9P6ART2_9AGAM|nr:hypothetical protein BS47DRAFT_1365083 [Hydnum rufescens UP504]
MHSDAGTQARLHQGHMARDEGHANEQQSHEWELAATSPPHKVPFWELYLNEGPDVGGHLSWRAVLLALDEISQMETNGYITQPPSEDAVAFSYHGHPILPFPMITLNACDFPAYHGEKDGRVLIIIYGPDHVHDLTKEWNTQKRLNVFAMIDDICNTILEMEQTICLCHALTCMLLGGFNYPIWPIDPHCAGSMFFFSKKHEWVAKSDYELSHFLQALERWGIQHWCIEGHKDYVQLEMDAYTGPTPNTEEEVWHQSFLAKQIHGIKGNIIPGNMAWVNCGKLMASIPFTNLQPPAATWS